MYLSKQNPESQVPSTRPLLPTTTRTKQVRGNRKRETQVPSMTEQTVLPGRRLQSTSKRASLSVSTSRNRSRSSMVLFLLSMLEIHPPKYNASLPETLTRVIKTLTRAIRILGRAGLQIKIVNLLILYLDLNHQRLWLKVKTTSSVLLNFTTHIKVSRGELVRRNFHPSTQ